MFKKETGPRDVVKGTYRRRGVLLLLGAIGTLYLSIEFILRLVLQNDRSAVGLTFSFIYALLGVVLYSMGVHSDLEYRQLSTLERV